MSGGKRYWVVLLAVLALVLSTLSAQAVLADIVITGSVNPLSSGSWTSGTRTLPWDRPPAAAVR